MKASSVLPNPSISIIERSSSQPQHYVEKSSKSQSTLILKSSSQNYVRVSSAYQLSSSMIPKPSLKPLSQNDNTKRVFISSLLVLGIAVCILALG